MAVNKKQLPPLTKLSQIEAESILSMFNMYDYNCSGRLPKRLVEKLLQTIGFGAFSYEITATDMSIKELLLFIDLRCPDPEPALECALYTFLNLASRDGGQKGKVLTPQDLADFEESIGRPACSMRQADLLLTSMLDYDDCEKIPACPVDYFQRDVVKFAKKNNLMKDFR